MKCFKNKSYTVDGRKYLLQCLIDDQGNSETLYCDFCVKDLQIRQKFFDGIEEAMRGRRIDAFFKTFKRSIELVYPNVLVIFNYPRTTNITCSYKSELVEVMMHLVIYIPREKFVKKAFFDGKRDMVINMVINMVKDIAGQLKLGVNNG